MAQPPPPAGWYPDPQDPQDPQVLRFWDGSSWTDHRHPTAPAAATQAAAHQSTPQAGGTILPAATGSAGSWEANGQGLGRAQASPNGIAGKLRLHQGETPLLAYQPSLGGCWLQMLLTLGLYAIWRSETVFAVTNQRVIYKKGILSKTERSVPLSQVQDATVFTQLWVAGVQISTAGGAPSIERLAPITPSQARAFADRVLQSAHQVRGAAFVPAAGSPQPTIVQQIQQLAVLRDQGVLSDAEFEMKKAELLARM